MTERLYYNDSLLLEFEAQIEEIIQNENVWQVRLNRTAFYPTSGGQLFDTGTINDVKVINVTEDNGKIYHHIDAKPIFEEGDNVTGMIDPTRRRANMQKHTGQHILSQMLVRECQAKTVSAHLGEIGNTIDIDLPALSVEHIARTERRANQVIYENLPVEIVFCPRDKLGDYPLRKIPTRDAEELRLIIIKDYDWTPCGGTHCATTGGVGIIKITGSEKVRGNVRLHFLTGLEALEDYRWKHDYIESIARKFSCHGRDTIGNIDNLIALQADSKKTITALRKELQPSMIDKWLEGLIDICGHKVLSLDYSGGDFTEAREAVLGIISKEEIIAIIGCDDKILVAVSESVSISAREILSRVMDRLGGRGGGSDQLAQGGGCSVEDVKILIADPKWIFDI